MLTEWFELNGRDENARRFLYNEIPKHYVWKPVPGGHNHWATRQRGASTVMGRMYNVSPRRRELFHLRILLLYVRGARSFEELRTVDDTVYGTFEAACRARNLLADDREWIRCMDEASKKDMPSTLRKLFSYILIFCEVGDPQALWNKFKSFLMEDFVKRMHKTVEEAEQRTILKIRAILNVHGLSITNYGFKEPAPLPPLDHGDEEGEESRDRLRRQGEDMVARLNEDQKRIFDRIKAAVEDDRQEERLFHVSGAAGTGKTFLYNTLLTVFQGLDIKVIAVAWTGLAASLLKGGRTVHSQFQLPIPVLSSSESRLKSYSKEGRFVAESKFIIWDEISLTTATAFDLIDRTLKRLCNDQRPFGGKTVVVGGDFKQCLPVVEASDRIMSLKACVKNADVWTHFVRVQLKANMRVNKEETMFLDWLENLGAGTLPEYEKRKNYVRIPSSCIVDSLDTLVEEIFPFTKSREEGQEGGNATVEQYNGAILTPLNVSCDVVNAKVLLRLPGDNNAVVTYLSVDSVEKKKNSEEVEALNYSTEFLNKLSPSGYPPHRLELKVNATVMLLKNLNVQEGLCNGTRLVLRHLGDNHLDGETIGEDGKPTGVRVFIPRVDVCQEITDLPHKLKRRQFPVRLAYAITINKAQGQTFDRVGIYLPFPVFDHGQLYVAFSRARSMAAVKVFVVNYGPNGRPLPIPECSNFTKNIVFTELFGAERCEAEVPPHQRDLSSAFVDLYKPPPVEPERQSTTTTTTAERKKGEEVSKTTTTTTAATESSTSLQSFQSENRQRGLITGLRNPHPTVSCYANVIVQCLFQLPEIIACIQTQETQFQRLLYRLWKGQQLDCVELRRCIGGIFVEDRQQDCQEFLDSILNGNGSGGDGHQLPEYVRHLFRYELRTTLRCPQCEQVVHGDGVPSLFDGMHYVPLPDDVPSTSFKALFAWREQEGTLCNNCQINLLLGEQFGMLSKYLIIILPRYRDDGSKNDIVFYDFDPDRCTIGGRTFRTIGIVRHRGATTSSGHYVCDLRNDRNMWLECDDEHVSIHQRRFDYTLRDVYMILFEVVV